MGIEKFTSIGRPANQASKLKIPAGFRAFSVTSKAGWSGGQAKILGDSSGGFVDINIHGSGAGIPILQASLFITMTRESTQGTVKITTVPAGTHCEDTTPIDGGTATCSYILDSTTEYEINFSAGGGSNVTRYYSAIVIVSSQHVTGVPAYYSNVIEL